MKIRFSCALAMAILVSVGASAGEGMWMPQQVPLFAEQLEAMGMTIPAASFADLTAFPMGAVISLGGCTASFVSPQGLVVTNHHCAFGSIQHNSTPDRDLTVNGFLANSFGEELPAAPGTKVWVTTKIDDVTEHLRGKIDGKITGAKRHAVIEERTKSMIAECERGGGVRCRVASFFEGSQYLRIRQLEIRDVRLAYAPAEGVGNYGGDVDNYMWPRHTGDFSFYRAYVGKDGKPADYSKDNVPFAPAHWLKVSTGELNEGDLIIVAGYPGRTSRHITAEEFRVAYEFRYPRSIEHFRTVLEILRAESAKSDESRIRLASRIESYANQLKRFEGTWEGMSKGNLIERKRSDEAELAAWIAGDPARVKKYGGTLEEISKLNQRRWARMEGEFLASWLTRASTLLSEATTINRLALERRSKDSDREPGYQERDFPRIKSSTVRAQKTLDLASERELLGHFLKLAAALPQGQRIDAVDKALAATGEAATDAQVAALLDRLYASTKMAELSERNAMLAETPAELKARGDAFLDLAAAMLPQQLADEELAHEISGSMAVVRPRYMEAMKAKRGGMLYPDANGTLRVTFGTVEGYRPRDGVAYKPQTTVAGLLEKETGVNPFNSPIPLLEAIRSGTTEGYLDAELGAVPVDFLSTADTTGGSSGSPTLNRKGELCGLGFDGIYESISKDWVFDPELTRAIHVDSRFMLWVMDYIDGAHTLMREMGVEPRAIRK